MLILDEADKILDIGFKADIENILKLLPQKRQNVLISATLTPKVSELSNILFKDSHKPLFIDTDKSSSSKKNSNLKVPDNLKQAYVICEGSQKFSLFFTFLKVFFNL